MTGVEPRDEAGAPVGALTEPSAVEPSVPSQRSAALPPDLPALLRRAFATDAAHRLPRLRAATGTSTWDADQHDVVLRDAHTIASSASVVGLTSAARAAKAAEDALRAWRNGDPAACAAVAEAVAELDVALAAG